MSAQSNQHLAAEQDHAAAQYMLGRALQTGQGITQSVDEAVAWYRKSAAQEYAAAHGVSQTVIQTRDGAVAYGDGSTALGAGAQQIQVGGSVSGGITTTGGRAGQVPSEPDETDEQP